MTLFSHPNPKFQPLSKRLTCALVGLMALPVVAQERLPTLNPNQYTPAQQQAAADFEQARHTPVFGPFEPLMHSPQLMSQARAMGDYLRYGSAIGTTLSELVILVTARVWTQDYEWYVHQPLAVKQGISKETTQAIANGERPAKLSEDEEMVYNFASELHQNKSVSDASFARVEKRFGKAGTVDIAGLCGYYTLLAMELNLAQYPLPPGAQTLPRLPNNQVRH
jgi:4-carboxymuconolactone decarboxylase